LASYSKKRFRVLRYPFLIEDVLGYLGEKGYIPASIDLAEAVSMVGAGRRIKEIVEDSVKYGHYRPEDDESKLPMEAIAFHVALIIAGRIGGKWLVNRLSVSVSKSVSNELPSFDDEDLLSFSRLLGIKDSMHHGNSFVSLKVRKKGSTLIEQRYSYSISMYEYLEATNRLSGDPSWKLTNQLLLNGRVFMERKRFERIIEEIVAKKVASLYEKYSEVMKVASLPSPLNEIEMSLKEALKGVLARKEVSSSYEYSGKGPISTEAFPPCIKRIYERAMSGENLSHAERFALATFLIAIGADEDYLLEIFKRSPDYNERIAKYQIEHLMGKKGSGTKYKTYSCSKMKSFSLCIADCGTKTPVQKYYLDLKKQRSGK